MKLVLDTNVIIAAFIAHGVCNELLEHCALYHTIVLSRFILDEFKDKLTNKFGFTAREANRAIRLLESRCLIVTPSRPSKAICRDPDDDQIIGAAVAGSCDCIVTGDKDLRDLKEAAGIPVISPSQFWEFENK